jgi:hypothetical protein
MLRGLEAANIHRVKPGTPRRVCVCVCVVDTKNFSCLVSHFGYHELVAFGLPQTSLDTFVFYLGPIWGVVRPWSIALRPTTAENRCCLYQGAGLGYLLRYLLHKDAQVRDENRNGCCGCNRQHQGPLTNTEE